MSFLQYGGYSDSGVEWLGDLPSHWSIVPIKSAFKVVGGSTPKSDVSSFWDGEVPWITPADLSRIDGLEIRSSMRMITEEGVASCGTSKVPPGSVILSTRAPIGSIAITVVEACTNQGCKALVPRGVLDPRLLARTLSVATEQLNVRGKGTTFLELSADELGAFKIPIPPQTEQAAIVAFLDRETEKIDALVEDQRRLIELLKEKRQAVISRAVTKGLNPLAPMKDSGIEWLGEVPAHWRVVRLAQLFVEVVEPGNDELPILSVSIHSGVSDDELAEDEMERKVIRSEDRTKYRAVKPHDLTYNMMRAWQGGFGAVQVMGMVSPAYVVARPIDPDILSTELVDLILRTPRAVVEMKRHSRGITDFRLRLYWNEFKSLVVALPPVEEQQAILAEIAERTAKYDALTVTAESAIRLFRERRAALISAAVTGKIDVRAVVQPTNEVVEAA